MPWYLYLALKQLFPTGRRFPFSTVLSILGVSLGVALLLISTSVMAGFGHEIRLMMIDTQGEVQVRGVDALIEDPAALQKTIAAVPGVVASTPAAQGVAVLKFEGKASYPAMQGLDLEQVEKVLPHLREYVAGSLDRLDDDGVILSVMLAESLGAGIGSRVDVWSQVQLDRFTNADQIVLPRELRVVGIFQIGHQFLDSSLAIVTLRTMKDLHGIEQGAHLLNVKIAEDADPDEVAARINAVLPPAAPLRAQSWIESNESFLWILQLEKNMISFLLLFIVVVAAFSVANSLLISVVRKTREIGLLGALGANRLQVAACFCFQGLLIGVVGTLAGLGIGFTFLHYRREIVLLFTKLTQSEGVLERFYQFSHLPAHSDPAEVARIVVASIVISTLAALLPAWRASRLKPVEALRSE